MCDFSEVLSNDFEVVEVTCCKCFFALTFLFQAMSAAVCFMIDGKYLLVSLLWWDIVSTKRIQLVLLLKLLKLISYLRHFMSAFYQSFDFVPVV